MRIRYLCGVVGLVLLGEAVWLWWFGNPFSWAGAPKVPPGFRVELILEAPGLEAPTALSVSPQGDVYFAEDPMDMAGPPTLRRDRVWVLQGGHPSRKVLVADQLGPVLGLEVAGDRLFVVHAPYLSAFRLGPDGSPVGREDIFKDLGPDRPGSWGLNDHAPSAVRMGMDGRLYLSIGDKGVPSMARKEPEGAGQVVAEGIERRPEGGGRVSLEGGGVLRCRPDGTGLEVLASGTRNHFDIALDESDTPFVVDNTDDGDGWNERLMQVVEGAFSGYPWAYTRDPASVLVPLADFGSGAPTGAWAYADDGLPEEYRDRLFYCDWSRGQVLTVRCVHEGAGFRAEAEGVFMEGGEGGPVAFRPMAIRPTADGRGFYVADWGSDGWKRPETAGRIWKVTYTGEGASPAPRGRDSDPVDRLIRSLDHPAHTERLRAQRALESRGDLAAQALARLLSEGGASSPGRRHALWALRWLRPSEGRAAAERLAREDADATVRAQAVRVLGSLAGLRPVSPPAGASLRAALAGDVAPTVRLHAAAALGAWGGADDARALEGRLRSETDPLVRYAALRALKRCGRWDDLAGFVDLEGKAEGSRLARLDGLLTALRDVYDPSAVRLLARLAGDPDRGVRSRAVEALARVRLDRAPYAGGWWGAHPSRREPPPRKVPWAGTPVVVSALTRGLQDGDPEIRRLCVAGLSAGAKEPQPGRDAGRSRPAEPRRDPARPSADAAAERRSRHDALRDFARSHPGDPGRGGRLFHDSKGPGCARCHAPIDGGSRIGPDLASIGRKLDREELMTAVLEPSRSLAQGYETVVLATRNGLVLTGVFGGEVAGQVELVDAEGRRHSLDRGEVVSQTVSSVSVMPAGLVDGLDHQDFTDLLAYLASSRR